MTLNVIDGLRIVKNGLAKAGRTDLDPCRGSLVNSTKETFRFNPTSDIRDSILIKKMDLTLLFKNIPQDIRGIEFPPIHPSSNVKIISSYLDENNLPLFTSEPLEQPYDKQSELFINWKRLIGLKDLPLFNVELGLNSNYLSVVVSDSPIYTGSVDIIISD